MSKTYYMTPETELICFSTEDVITTSGEEPTDDGVIDLPFVPKD